LKFEKRYDACQGVGFAGSTNAYEVSLGQQKFSLASKGIKVIPPSYEKRQQSRIAESARQPHATRIESALKTHPKTSKYEKEQRNLL